MGITDGYGSGYGYGYGYGYGDGYGYGSGYLKAVAGSLIGAEKLEQSGGAVALWWSDKNGLACNGGSSGAAAFSGHVEDVSGPLRLCSEHALHTRQ